MKLQNKEDNLDNKRTLRRIKIIGIVLLVLGGLLVLSNGLSYLVLKLVDYPYEIAPYGKFYLSPIYLILTGILLIISGLLLRSLKTFGLRITIFSTILLFIVTTFHWTSNMEGFDGTIETIGTVGGIVFILIFLIPSILLIRFLLKKETKKNFT